MFGIHKEIDSTNVFLVKCFITNKPLNKGFVCEVDNQTIVVDDNQIGIDFILEQAKKQGLNYSSLDEAFDEDFYYWTTFEYNIIGVNEDDSFFDGSGVEYKKIGNNNSYLNLVTKELYRVVE